jgi:hypothetical protein
MKSKTLTPLATGKFYMKTRLTMALLLFGFLLLSACDGSGSTNKTGTSNCTLDSSALDSCTLN